MKGLRLTAEDIARLNVAQRILLSPLCGEGPTEWQLRANRAVRHLVRADHSVFSVPADSGPALVTDDTDPTFSERFPDYCMGVQGGEYRFRDPYIENAARVRRAAGTGAYHELELGGKEAIERSTAYQEIFVPAGLTHLIGLSTPMPVGEATQFFSFEGPGAERRSEWGIAVLHLLVPAFEAGMRIQRQLIARRTALASMLDQLGQAAAVYSTGGTPLHRTDAFNDLLAGEPEGERLWEGVNVLARALSTRWSGSNKTTDPPRPNDARANLRTPAAEYRLLGSYLGADLFGVEGVLVLVERLRPLLPAAADLRSRFTLTMREAEVALLLAEGLTDGTIAERLALSPHTARRYAERVLSKLGLHSRAAVAVTLLRDGGTACSSRAAYRRATAT